MANPMGVLLRESLFHDNETRLAQLANRTISRGIPPSDFVVVMIDVDDPSWRPLVDAMRPDENWQKIRDEGGEPVLRGTIYAKQALTIIADNVPDLVPGLQGSPPPGKVRAIVMAGGGASIHLIVPDPSGQLPT